MCWLFTIYYLSSDFPIETCQQEVYSNWNASFVSDIKSFANKIIQIKLVSIAKKTYFTIPYLTFYKWNS